MADTSNDSTKVPLKAYFDEKLGALERRIDAKADERDVRYTVMFQSRDTAIAAALAAQEKAVAAALAAQEKAVYAAAEASEKAITKAEIAQAGVNQRGNEFRASLDDYTKLMLPRFEADTRFSATGEQQATLTKQIAELREALSRAEGGTVHSQSSRTQSNWLIGLIVMGGASILGTLLTLSYFLINRH